MIHLKKHYKFSEAVLDTVKLLPYRGQLEFLLYYSLLNNSTSLIVSDSNILNNTLIQQKLSSQNFELMDIYALIHEIMYLTMLGRNKHSILLDNLEYLKSTLYTLLERMIEESNIDLIAELLLATQLLDIKFEEKIIDRAYNMLDYFLESNLKKTGIRSLLNRDFNKIYHQILVISLLQ